MCGIELRMTYAALGVLVCTCACVVWIVHFENVGAGVSALFAAVYAGLLLALHILYWRGLLDSWTSLHFLLAVLTGSLGQLIGIISIIVFIALGILNQTDFHNFYGDNWWLGIVWAWMLWKWAFLLFWYARKYRRELESDYVLGGLGVAAVGGGLGGLGVGGGLGRTEAPSLLIHNDLEPPHSSLDRRQ